MRVVIKVTGKLIEEPDLLRELACSLRDFRREEVVLVHGGGPAISEMLRRLGLQPQFRAGQRVTDEATLEVAEMVLSGKMNKAIVAALVEAGIPALGLSGRDAGLLRAQRASGEDEKLGLVGEIHEVRAALLRSLCAAGFLPVISPISSGPDGSALNVNADWAAAKIAAAWQGDCLLYFGDTPGVLADGRPVPELDGAEVAQLIRSGQADRGMIPKLQSALYASAAGVERVLILSWAGTDTLERVLKRGENLGTRVRQ
jgi:acetylglutamate kinase